MAKNTKKGYRKGAVIDRYAQRTVRGHYIIKERSTQKTIRMQLARPKGITVYENPRSPKP